MFRISAAALAAVALMACNQSDQPVQPHSDAAQPQAQAEQSGRLLREFKISDATTVRFRENAGNITVSLEGSIEEKERNQALETKLMSAPSMESAYRLLDSQGPVPQALLDYDKRPLSPATETAPPEAQAGSQGPIAPRSRALAKSASLDDTWDWTADANWWKGTVVGYPCGWHQALTYTNIWWADDWRQGWYSVGYLMAAGFAYNADAYAYIWRNGAWVQTDYYNLTPRHYITWFSGDKTKQWRRYRVQSAGGSSGRAHWGMRWDTQAPSDLGVICQG
jgi:hypothetical protein